jgi:hypothetical protein
MTEITIDNGGMESIPVHTPVLKAVEIVRA